MATSDSKTWNFLNSPFGLFILSSVLLSGMARLYTDHQSKLELARLLATEKFKLAAEFDHRLAAVAYHARAMRLPNQPPEEIQGQAVLLWRVVTGDPAFQPAMPEFKGCHWYGIVSRLQILGEINGADSALKAIEELEHGKGREWNYEGRLLDESLDALGNYRAALAKSLRLG